MITYISQNIKWIHDYDVSGKVYVSFVVKHDGNISDVVVEKGLSVNCDKEAVRVVKTMLLWKPGKVKGQQVDTKVLLGVPFKFNNQVDEP